MDLRSQARLADQLRDEGIRPVVVASHPRSGTHLLLDALRLNLSACDARKRWGEPRDRVYLDLDHIAEQTGRVPYRVAAAVLRKTARPLIKTHADAFGGAALGAGVNLLDRSLSGALDRSADVLYVHRDGREAICSLYLLIHGRASQAAPSLSQFLRERHAGRSRPRAWAEHARGWLRRPGTYGVRMRQLIREPATTLGSIAAALGVPAPVSLPVLPSPSSLLRGRLDRLFATRPRSTGILGNNPTRTTLDWRTAFTAEDRAFFDEEAGDILAELGYGPAAAAGGRGC